MLKNLLIFAALVLSATIPTPRADAATRSAQSVVESLKSTGTCQGMSISTATAAPGPTDVTADIRYSAVVVDNEDATANLFCSERSDVATSGGKRGRKIAAGKSKGWLLPLETRLFCISDGAASTAAMICKGD